MSADETRREIRRHAEAMLRGPHFMAGIFLTDPHDGSAEPWESHERSMGQAQSFYRLRPS